MLLGFDIGGTKCAVVLGHVMTAPGGQSAIRVVDKTVLPTNRPVYEQIEWLFATAEALLATNSLSKVQLTGIGLSCGGPLNSRAGVVLSPPNLPGWDAVPLVALAEARFGQKALLQNDANACALAEWKFGAGKGFQHLVFLTFGTGLGAGLILNGRLYAGASGLAGEAGHLRLAPLGPVGFGKAGSFEGFCSGGGIAQLAQMKVRQRLQMGERVSFCGSLEELPLLTAKVVAEAAFRGDGVARDIYATCGHYLGQGLALLIDLLNPECIILGSIYGRAKELLEPPMRAVLEAEAIGTSYRACAIVPAGLGAALGDMAALSLATACRDNSY
ncbi:ROK family protein [Paraflavisolibacter sp. H34]|uniref:ROK family protein n=1 Tax=Huijunlia imazamoxiresistens TaxID=3127457 RepID=UPI00301B0BB1